MAQTIYGKAGADAATAAAIAAQGLGTAATTDATDYATATQGEKADSASQPGHGHAAVAVTVTPAGGISATNVQTALEELDAEKVARGSASTATSPLLTATPIVAETVNNNVSGYNPATGTFYGSSLVNGHYQTSTDLNMWTDRTYSPSTYTPSVVGWEFDAVSMYAYSSTAKVWRAPIDVFNSWTLITPPVGPLTTGRVGSLCALGSGVLLYGNYTTTGGDGAHVWRSTDSGATWAETLTLATAKHIHAIRRNPTTGTVWCSVGDAGFPGLGLYKSTDSGATWSCMSTNDYGIDIAFLPAQGQWPALVVLEGDGLDRPHVMAFPEDGAPGAKTFPLVWGWSGPTTDPLSWRGTTRGLTVLPGNHLLWYTTAEAGVTGTRAGVWLAEAPDYRRVLLLKETTGAEPTYGRTFTTATYAQNLQRRYPTPTFGSY